MFSLLNTCPVAHSLLQAFRKWSSVRIQRAGRTPGTGYVALGTRGAFLAYVRMLWCRPQADRSSADGRSHEHQNRTPGMKSLWHLTIYIPPKWPEKSANISWSTTGFPAKWFLGNSDDLSLSRSFLTRHFAGKLVVRREMLAVFSGYAWMYFSSYRRWEGWCVCQPRESGWSVQIRPKDRENCVSKEGTSCTCKLV